VTVLAGSGVLLAPLEFVVILILAAALAYVTVRKLPKPRRPKR
jgi:hypothetical protein